MIWKVLLGQTESAFRGLRAATNFSMPQDSPCSSLDLVELEDRILMSATPLALDMMPDADLNEPIEVDSHTGIEPHIDLLAAGSHSLDHVADPGLIDTTSTLDDVTPIDNNAVDNNAVDNSMVPSERHELVFVDTSIDGYNELLEHIADNQDESTHLEIIELDSSSDGIEQIGQVLQRYDQLDAVHIVSHGNDTAVRLGDVWLNADRLNGYAGDIAQWSDAFAPEGDLLLYGCNLASTADGQSFLEGLQVLTGADVAASTDVTGNTALGGDWDLEFSIGVIETGELLSHESQQQWAFVLPTENVYDGFESHDYSGGTGSGNWSGPWHEVGDDDSETSGSVAIAHYDLDQFGSHSVEIDAAAGVGIYRGVDLDDASSAELSFDYQRHDSNGFLGSALDIQVSNDNGSNWNTVHTISAGIDPTPQGLQLDISPYMASGTQIRFLSTASGTGSIFLDHIDITYETNIAPILQPGGALTLSPIQEDAFGDLGNTVAEIIASAGGDRITDGNPGALEGIAIIGTDDSDGVWQFDAHADGNWQVFGPVDETSAVLLDTASRIRFAPTADYHGTGGQIEFRAWDQTSGGIGDTGVDASNNGGAQPYSAQTDSASITVESVNDQPNITLPANQFATEDTDLAIAGITIADVDAGTDAMLVTLNVSDGTLTLGDTTNLSFSTGTGTADDTMTFSGTVTDINSALATLSYRGDLDFNGADALSITVDDQGNNGLGGPLQDADNIAINVLPVNDQPLLTVPTDQSINEDTDLAISGITIADVDAGTDAMLVTLNVSDGTLTLGDTSNLSFSTGTGTADDTMTFSGTVTDINSALATLSYRGDLDFNGADALSIMVDDQGNNGLGGPLQDAGNIAINVLPVNDSPTSAGISDIRVDEDTASSTIDLHAAFDDAEDSDAQLVYKIVGITNPALFKNAAIQPADGTLVLEYASDMNGTTEITLEARDTEGLTVTETFKVEVTPVNDAPVGVNDHYSVRGDEVLYVKTPGILANDSDTDGDKLSVVLRRGPRHGTLTINTDGSFRYVPDPSFIGKDSFTYFATDGESISQRTRVVIKVLIPTSPIDTEQDVLDDDTPADDSDATQPVDLGLPLSSLVNAELPDGVSDTTSRPNGANRQHNRLVDTLSMNAEGSNYLLLDLAKQDESNTSMEAPSITRSRYTDDVHALAATSLEVVDATSNLALPTVDSATLFGDIADMDTLLDDDDALHRIMIGSAVGLTTGLTVGYVFWTIRAGYLLTSLVAQMPAWRLVDPLPILNSLEGNTMTVDGESLESIAQSDSAHLAV